MAFSLHASAAAAASGAIPSISKSHTPMMFFDLPPETQRAISSHCSNNDLVCLALVSKRFRELVAEQLYRNFSIIIEQKDVENQNPVYRLASELETLTTSNYNYAKHLRGISMDTLVLGSKGQRLYHDYLCKNTCEKLLNNLLYLAIRRAQLLETFHWNVRVELSRPVFRELHRLPSLVELHIRMQAGDSYWSSPPPLPLAANQDHIVAHHPNPQTPPLSWPHHYWFSLSSTSIFQPTAPQTNTGTQLAWESSSSSLPTPQVDKQQGCRGKDLPTLSGFKNLRSLAVLDIDNPYTINEIKTCIRNSSSTLTELKLSFSDALGAPVRKPPSNVDPEDSDPDGDFHLVPPQQNTNDGPNSTKELQKQEMRKFHEEALAMILDVRPSPPRDSEKNDPHGRKGVVGQASKYDQPQHTDDSRTDSSGSRQGLLSIPRRGPRGRLVNATGLPAQADGGSDAPPTKSHVRPEDENQKVPAIASSSSDKAPRKRKGRRWRGRKGAKAAEESKASPKNNNVAESETGVDTKDGNVDESSQLPDSHKLREMLGPLQALAVSLMGEMERLRLQGYIELEAEGQAAERQLRLLSGQLREVQNQIRLLERELRLLEQELQDTEKRIEAKTAIANAAKHPVKQYARQTRGLSLESLSIQLMLVKPWVLAKAVKLDCLTQLTLLNVGDQIPIWCMMISMSINAVVGSALPLSTLDRSHGGTTWMIITDSVPHHLACVSPVPRSLRSLRAVDIMHFRNGDTCIWVVHEMRRFIVDNLSHHPHMVLEWIVVESERVDQIIRTAKEKKPKSPAGSVRAGKNKEKIRWRGQDLDYSTAVGWSLLHPFPSLPSEILGSDDDDDIPEVTTRLKVLTRGPLRFHQAPGIKIFEKEIRSGQL